ncbi:MAG TPA: ThiF family adenylyltransferase [Terriglobia bacterium]|nr:ThiF family adenylyltransferase [Terriglobia bacterium]
MSPLMKPDDRYSRQERFAPIGPAGQARIQSSRVAIIGLGALGSVAADQMARAGVGYLRLVDRDFVELSNLQRQSLYDEDDVRANLPKAVAAQRRLARINSSVRIEAVVDDVNATTVEDIIDGVDLVLDGLDNFETRFTLNDACAKRSCPWIYAAAVGSSGVEMPILPGRTPCLRCFVENLPAPGSSPTCDTAGVIAPITHVIASIQVADALRILSGQLEPRDIRLVSYDAWSGAFRRIDGGAPSKDCPVCAGGRYDYLAATALRAVTLCGRNAVQLIPSVKADLDFLSISRAVSAFGPVEFNDFLLQCTAEPYRLTLFKDGRAIVRGTEEAALARSLYSKMIGS